MTEAIPKLSHAAQEALHRATDSASFTNYPTIFEGFIAKGIAEADIKPRENVFTFNAWKALGRSVRKGEHGVKVVTFIECSGVERDPASGEEKPISYRGRGQPCRSPVRWGDKEMEATASVTVASE